MIANNVNSVKKHGFINYFGMQRFGSYNIHTHTVGVQVLKRNWVKVIEMLLTQHADIADSDEIERKQKIRELVFEK